MIQGGLTLSFFERRKTQQLFGLVSNEERVIWEQWHLHVVVNNTPRPVNDDRASVIERQRMQVRTKYRITLHIAKYFSRIS